MDAVDSIWLGLGAAVVICVVAIWALGLLAGLRDELRQRHRRHEPWLRR